MIQRIFLSSKEAFWRSLFPGSFARFCKERMRWCCKDLRDSDNNQVTPEALEVVFKQGGIDAIVQELEQGRYRLTKSVLGYYYLSLLPEQDRPLSKAEESRFTEEVNKTLIKEKAVKADQKELLDHYVTLYLLKKEGKLPNDVALTKLGETLGNRPPEEILRAAFLRSLSEDNKQADSALLQEMRGVLTEFQTAIASNAPAEERLLLKTRVLSFLSQMRPELKAHYLCLKGEGTQPPQATIDKINLILKAMS